MKEDLSDKSEELRQIMEEDDRLTEGLTNLFGRDTVEQARQIDIADLSLNEEMTRCIAAGVNKLKELKADSPAQRNFVINMEPGTRLLICMWIMDMNLLEKILARPNLKD